MWRDIPEQDWKYLRSIQEVMLEELARRINDEVREILSRDGVSENEKRGRVYDIVRRRDRIVAECFDGWSRSKMYERCWSLRTHGLLRPEHIEKLTPETQKAVAPLPPQ